MQTCALHIELMILTRIHYATLFKQPRMHCHTVSNGLLTLQDKPANKSNPRGKTGSYCLSQQRGRQMADSR